MTQQRPILKLVENHNNEYIEEWIPDSEDEVCLHLTLGFGMEDCDGTDLYNVQVVTPQSISHLNLGREIASDDGRGFLVVSPYSWIEVICAIEKILESCVGDSYKQAIQPLNKHFHWEGNY